MNTYKDRTGHTFECMDRAVSVLAASGDFDRLALTGIQQEAAALDALTSEDVECECGPTDLVEPDPRPRQSGPAVGAQPWASRDGESHLAYYAEGFSFVWTGDAADPIEASHGGYGEPVTALIPVEDTDLATAMHVAKAQGIAPACAYTFLLRALTDAFLARL